ncbi:MAG: transcription antitermination factor NusB [Dehalococcoidia bacterium]|nr:transcription antitermination factor NusB [Dehalococcoidia bacterium]
MRNSRRKARVLAFQVLFEVDCTRHDVESVLQHVLEDAKMEPLLEEFAQRLARGVRARQREIDGIIQRLAPAWPVGQLAPVDRNILRVALFEILFDNETPPKAAINEAVEIAKLFGGEASPKFVNGVLGSLMAEREKATLVSA